MNDYTAVPKDAGYDPEPSTGPPAVRPWSEGQNRLFVRMVENALRELRSTHAGKRNEALHFFQNGCEVLIPHRRHGLMIAVSLLDEWDWPRDAIARKAREIVDETLLKLAQDARLRGDS